jgi:hypothetical protein
VNALLGLTDAALILFVIGLRALTGFFLMGKSLSIKTFFAFIFVGFFTAMLLKGYKDPFSLLPWFAASLTTIVQLYATGITLRLIQSCGADGAWVAYNIVNNA